MTSQQQNPFPPNPQGYAQLSEDDPNSAGLSPNKQEYPANIPQGTPVIVQGVPAMSYPAYVTAAPMSTFDIYNPAPSQIQKLNSCPYVCYKYWIAISIIFDLLTFVSVLLGRHDFVSHIPGLTFFYYILLGWQVFQLGHIFIGIRDKNLQKVRKGVYMMKIYIILLGIFYLILMFDAYEQLYEQVARQRGHREPGEQGGQREPAGNDEDIYRVQNIVAVIIGVIIAEAGIIGGWFLVYLLPAMKVRDILQTAPGQANSGPNANV